MVYFCVKVGQAIVADTYIDLGLVREKLGEKLKCFASRAAIQATFQFVAESVATKEAFVQQEVHICYGRNHDCYTIMSVDLGFYPKAAENLDALRDELVTWFREILASIVLYRAIDDDD